MAKIKKEELKNLKKIEGEVRGVAFQTDAEYVLKKKEDEGLQALEKKTREMGYHINYKDISATRWYPLTLRVVSLLSTKEAFGWGNKEIFDMGNSAPKYSFIVKILMRTFLSLKKTFEECPKYWQKHYTVGELVNYEYNEEKKYLVLQLKEFKVHPVLCPYFAGYFLRIGQFVVKGEKITIKETKCPFKGASFHEFVISWE